MKTTMAASVAMFLLAGCAVLAPDGADTDGADRSELATCAAADPCNVHAIAVESTAVTIAWDRPADTSSFGRYVVLRRVSGAGTFTQVAKLNDAGRLSSTVSGLTSGTVYEFKVEQRSKRGALLGTSSARRRRPAARRRSGSSA